MKAIFSASIFLMLCVSAFGQSEKVANYSFGEIGAKNYEELSFWVKDEARAEITYSYGKDGTSVDLMYVANDTCKGQPCFILRFPNNYTLNVVPKGYALKVTDDAGRYSRIFGWEYQGPINGVGMFCTPCAEDEKEAMEILKRYYLK